MILTNPHKAKCALNNNLIESLGLIIQLPKLCRG